MEKFVLNENGLPNSKYKIRDNQEILVHNITHLEKADLDFELDVSDIEYSETLPSAILIHNQPWVKNIVKPTVQTFESFKIAWSSFTTMLVCRHVKQFRELLNLQMDRRLQQFSQALHSRKRTPDFILATPNELIIYEFKSFLYKPTSSKIKSTISKVAYKYYVPDMKTRLIIVMVIADDALPSVLHCKIAERSVYKRIREDYWIFLKAHPDYMQAMKGKSEEVYTPLPILISEFPFNPLTKRSDFISDDNVSPFKIVEKKILNNITKVKNHLVEKLLDLNSLPQQVFTKPLRQNIFEQHPLNRDENKNMFRYLNSDMYEDHGHCSTQLLPYLCGFLDMSYHDFYVYSSKKFDIISELITKNRLALEEQNEIKIINRYSALLDTEYNDTVYKEINEILKIKSDSREDAKSQLFVKRAALVAKARSKIGLYGNSRNVNWTMTGRTTMKLKNKDLARELHINIARLDDIQQTTKRFPDFGFWSKIQKFTALDFIKAVPETEFLMKTAFDGISVKAQKLFEDLSANSLEFFKLLWKFGPFKSLFYTMVLFRDLLMGVPVHTAKYGKPEEFSVVESTLTGSLLVCSVNVNDITTGVIKVIQEVPKKVYDMLMSPGQAYGRFRKIKRLNHGQSYWIESDFFRLNLQFVAQFDSMIGAFIGNQALWFSLHNSLQRNGLWNSMYFNYSRPLTNVLDYIYTTMMRSFSDICFGKDDAKGKFDTLELKDLRCGTIYKNSVDNYEKFCGDMQSYAKAMQWIPVTDPYFGIELSSFYDFLFIAYSKQIYLHEDGADPAKLLWGFYLLDCEQQKDWNTNPFNMMNNDKSALKFDVDDFFDNLFEDEDNKKWRSVTYCPEYIISAMKFHYASIKGKIKGDFLTHTSKLLPTETLRNSKVNVPKSWEVAYKPVVEVKRHMLKEQLNRETESEAKIQDINKELRDLQKNYKQLVAESGDLQSQLANENDAKLVKRLRYKLKMVTAEQKKINLLKSIKRTHNEFKETDTKDETIDKLKNKLKTIYPGLLSVTLSEAIFEEVRYYKEHHDEYEKWLGKDLLVKLDQEPSLLELAMFEFMRYPQINILVPHLKAQKGWAKRQFYQQIIYGRNAHKVKDEGCRPVLLASPFDMLMTSGDEKFPLLEEDMKETFVKVTDPSIGEFSIEDMTKFGDLFPLEAEECLFEALTRCGFLEPSERDFISHCSKMNHGRFHVMPAKSQELYNKTKENIESNEVVKEGVKFAVYQKIEQAKVMNERGQAKGLNYKELTEAIIENMGIFKYVGFGLGTDNVISTILALFSPMMIQDIMKDIHPDIKVKGKVHSDDAIKFSNLPRISEKDYKHWQPTVLLNFLELTKPKDRIIDNNKQVIFANVHNQKLSGKHGIDWISLTDVTCLYVTLCMIAPRLVGMRPSMLKWYFAPVGEVLQTVYTKNGSFIPLIRYTSALFKDLPGKSFSTDLINCCARCLQPLQHGGTADLALTLMLSSNILVRWRFGKKDGAIRFDKHPCMFGGWISMPLDLIQFGFDANTIRLLASAQNNKTLEHELMLLMMTDEAWDLKGKASNIKVIEAMDEGSSKEVIKDNGQYATIVPKEEFDRIGDTFMDFLIYFSRQVKTLRSFKLQVDRFKSSIEAAQSSGSFTSAKGFVVESKRPKVNLKDTDLENKSRKAQDDAETLKQIMYNNLPIFLYGIASFDLKVVKHLTKYLLRSFQDAYLKVSRATQVINRLGLPNRLLIDCLKTSETYGELITLSQMISRIEITALDITRIPDINIKMYAFMLSVHQDDVNRMLNNNYEYITTEIKDISFQLSYLERLKYKKVRRENFDIATGYKTKELIGLLIENISWELPVEGTTLMAYKPWLLYNDKFMSLFNQIRGQLITLDIKGDSLEQNAVVLERLLDSTNRPIVLKTDSDQLVHSMFELRSMLGYKFTFVNYQSGRIFSEIVTSRNKSETISNLIARAFLIKSIFIKETEDIAIQIIPEIGEIRSKGVVINLDLSSFINNLFTDRNSFTKMDASTLLTYLNVVGSLENLYLRYTNNFKDAYDFYLVCSKATDGKMKAPISFKKYGSVDNYDFFDFAVALIYNGSGFAAFSVKGQERLIIFRTGTDQQLKMLYQLAFNFLDRSSKFGKYGRKSIEDVILEVEPNEGMFSFSSEQVWLIQGGNSAMYHIEQSDFQKRIFNLVSSPLIYKFKKYGQVWMQIGFIKNDNKHEKFSKIPKLYTPWVVDSTSLDCSLYSDVTLDLLFDTRFRKGPRLSLLLSTIERIEDYLANFVDLRGLLVSIIKEFKSTEDNKIFPHDIFRMLINFLPLNEILFETNEEIIPTLEGPMKIIHTTNKDTTSYDEIDLTDFLLNNNNSNPQSRLIKAFVKLTLIGYTSLNTCYPIIYDFNIMTKTKSTRQGLKMSTRSFIDIILHNTSYKTQFMTLLNNNMIDMNNPQILSWVESLIRYSCDIQTSEDINSILEIFTNWKSLDDNEKLTTLDRINVIANLDALNCSEGMMSLIIQEYVGSTDCVIFINRLQNISIIPFYKNSRVWSFFIRFWGNASLGLDSILYYW